MSLETIEVEIIYLKRAIEKLTDAIEDMAEENKEMANNINELKTKLENQIVESKFPFAFVHGTVKVILTAVIIALLALIIKSQ